MLYRRIPRPERLIRLHRHRTIGFKPLPGGAGRHGDAFLLGLAKSALDFNVIRRTVGNQVALPTLPSLIFSPDKKFPPD